MITVFVEVLGLPAAQGSKRHVGGGRMIEQSKNVAPWRESVTHAACGAIAEDRIFFPITAPVAVHVTFWFPRPKLHYRTGRRSDELRENAPYWHAKTPDIDKTLRSTLDALTLSGIWRDDAQVVHADAQKVYADHRGGDNPSPGATIRIEALT